MELSPSLLLSLSSNALIMHEVGSFFSSPCLTFSNSNTSRCVAVSFRYCFNRFCSFFFLFNMKIEMLLHWRSDWLEHRLFHSHRRTSIRTSKSRKHLQKKKSKFIWMRFVSTQCVRRQQQRQWRRVHTHSIGGQMLKTHKNEDEMPAFFPLSLCFVSFRSFSVGNRQFEMWNLTKLVSWLLIWHCVTTMRCIDYNDDSFFSRFLAISLLIVAIMFG